MKEDKNKDKERRSHERRPAATPRWPRRVRRLHTSGLHAPCLALDMGTCGLKVCRQGQGGYLTCWEAVVARWMNQQGRRSHQLLIRGRTEQLGWWQGRWRQGRPPKSAGERCSPRRAAMAIALCLRRQFLLLPGCRGSVPARSGRSCGLQSPSGAMATPLARLGFRPALPAAPGRSSGFTGAGQATATSVALRLQGLPLGSPLLSSRLHPTRAPPHCAARQPLLKKPALRHLAAAQPAVPPPPAEPQGQPQGAAPQSAPNMSRAAHAYGSPFRRFWDGGRFHPLWGSSRADMRRGLGQIMLSLIATGVILQAPLPYWGCVCYFLIWGLLCVL